MQAKFSKKKPRKRKRSFHDMDSFFNESEYSKNSMLSGSECTEFEDTQTDYTDDDDGSIAAFSESEAL